MNFLIRAAVSALLIVSCLSVSAFAEPKPSVVNINTADAASLAAVLSGVGKSKAEAIIQYRQSHGDFKALEELTEVKGIGLKLIKQNEGKIKL